MYGRAHHSPLSYTMLLWILSNSKQSLWEGKERSKKERKCAGGGRGGVAQRQIDTFCGVGGNG